MSRIQNDFNPQYPSQPSFKKDCPVNYSYQTIRGNPRVQWAVRPTTPTTIKNLYTGIPNFYPLDRYYAPENSFYGHDFSQFIIPGVRNPPVVSQRELDILGVDGVRLNYGWKPYPFSDRVMNETVPIANSDLPYMSYRKWVKTPVVNDNNLNSYFEVSEPRFPIYD